LPLTDDGIQRLYDEGVDMLWSPIVICWHSSPTIEFFPHINLKKKQAIISSLLINYLIFLFFLLRTLWRFQWRCIARSRFIVSLSSIRFSCWFGRFFWPWFKSPSNLLR